MSDFDLEAEVRDLAARRDILAATMRYMRAQDRLLPDLHRSAFWEDATVDCGLWAGPADGFVDFAQTFLAQLEASQHLIGQADIAVHGDEADGEIYFMAWHRTGGDSPKDLFVCGRYVDRYQCRAGEWRIWKRRELIDWVREDSVSDQHFIAGNGAKLLWGARGAADFSVGRDWAGVGQ